jgi:hypothetical protein
MSGRYPSSDRRDSGSVSPGAITRLVDLNMTIKEPCVICPHQSDCLKINRCLDEINLDYLARHRNQFPRLMTPVQANEFMAALRAGKTIKRITNGGKIGRMIATVTKFRTLCEQYANWGLEARALAAANAKAADKLKDNCSSRTHCRRGHEFAVHGLAYKSHVNGRRHRYCKLCNKINSRQGAKLPDSMIEKIKSLVRSGKPLNSFTSGGKPGYLCRFASIKLLRQEDLAFNNLVLLGARGEG